MAERDETGGREMPPVNAELRQAFAKLATEIDDLLNPLDAEYKDQGFVLAIFPLQVPGKPMRPGIANFLTNFPMDDLPDTLRSMAMQAEHFGIKGGELIDTPGADG